MGNNGFLKSAKMYLMTLVLAAFVTVGTAFGFTGCAPAEKPNENTNQNDNQNQNNNNNDQNNNDNQNNNDDNQNTPTPDPTPTPPPTPDDSLTYQQFITQHPEIATQFALDMTQELSYADDILSTSYAFVANEDKIEQVLLANVVETGETERQLKIATVNLIGGVDVQDIVDGVDMPIITIESETALTFDAKEEYKKGDTSSIQTQIDAAIKQHLGDDATSNSTYTPEIFAPTTVAELVADYPDKVNDVLNEKCMSHLLNSCYILGYDESKVKQAKWYLEGENEVTAIKYYSDYTSSINLVSLVPSQDITIDDMLIGNFEISRTNWDYAFGYSPAIQGARDELMNGIFEHFGMYKECP